MTVCALQFGNPLGVLAQAAGSILFEGARVIVGDESAAIENAAILVENGRIHGRRTKRERSGRQQEHPASI